MNTSVASMMNLVDGYKFLNTWGILLSTISLEGQIGTSLNLQKQKSIHILTIRETVGCDTWNLLAKSCSSNPSHSRHYIIKIHSTVRGCVAFLVYYQHFDSIFPLD